MRARAVVTRLPVLISTVVLSALMGTTAAATLPSHIDRTALDAVEEQRRNYYSYEQSDYRHRASGLSVYRSYLYQAASAKEGVYGSKQGWRFQRTGLSSLQRYTLSDPANVADNPLLRNLPAGEYAIIGREDGSADRFKLENGKWTGADSWNTGALAFQSQPSGGGRWEQQDESGAVARFNEQGQLLELAANDQHHTYAYSQAGLLTSIQAQDGETLTFDYGHADRMSSFTNHRNETTHYEYDSQGRLTAVIKPDDTPELSDNPTERYQYSDAGHPLLLTGIVSPLNYLVVENRYDNATDELVYKRLDQKGGRSTAATNGTVHSERHWSNGLRIRYVNAEPSAITRDGREVTGLEAVALERQQAQDGGHYIERSSYALENASCLDCIVRGDTHYGPTGEQLKTKELRANGVLIEQEFVVSTAQDGVPVPLTRRETRHGQLVKLTRWNGDADNNLILSEEFPGRKVSYQYNESGLRISETLIDTDSPSAASSIIRYQYNGDDLLVSLDGPRTDINDITTFDYDGEGNLITVANPLGQAIHYEYDKYNRRTALVDQNGMRTTIEYGVNNRVLSSTLAAGSAQAVSTRYSYNQIGNYTGVNLPGGYSVQRQYDALGRVKKLMDGESNWVDYHYDADGNLIESTVYDQEQQEMVQQAKLAYDDLNRLTNSGDTSYQYRDNNPNPIDIVSGGGDVTKLGYDDLGRLTNSTNALGGVTQLVYNDRHQLTSVTDAEDVTTSYDYNGLGQRIAEHSPATGTTTFKYDPAGNLIKQTRQNGTVIKRRFDALNRVTRIAFKQNGKDRKVLKYQYDNCQNGLGKLCKVSGSAGVVRYQYDERGNYSKVINAIDGLKQVTHYQYNEHNQIERLTYPSGLKVRYHYSKKGLVKKVTAKQGGNRYVVADNLRYRPMASGIKRFDLGNGLQTKHKYDMDGRIKRITTQSASGNDNTEVQNLRYRYDANGNVSDIIRNRQPDWSQSYNYDELRRLIAEQRTDRQQEYQYDQVSNRLQQTITRTTKGGNKTRTKDYQYNDGGHRLTNINNQDLHYDSNGNLIEDRHGKRKFEYDVTNRLTAFYKNDQLKAQYLLICTQK